MLVAISPVGTVSVTTTDPSLVKYKALVTVMVYVAPVCPLTKFPVWDLLTLKSCA
jgi:hypothetical protein